MRACVRKMLEPRDASDYHSAREKVMHFEQAHSDLAKFNGM